MMTVTNISILDSGEIVVIALRKKIFPALCDENNGKKNYLYNGVYLERQIVYKKALQNLKVLFHGTTHESGTFTPLF